MIVVNPHRFGGGGGGGSSLPEKSDLQTLDFVTARYYGVFCQVPAKAAVDVSGLDFAYSNKWGPGVLIGNE